MSRGFEAKASAGPKVIFNGPRALWQKVWDEPARERFISNIPIFREVDVDIAKRLEKATGIQGYEGIAGLLGFNGTHNGMSSDARLRYANGMSAEKAAVLRRTTGPRQKAPTRISQAMGPQGFGKTPSFVVLPASISVPFAAFTAQLSARSC
ncbi:hypothetical protein B0H67DRAFT_643438 [Lasiosphaeris hirsuta]|uniref:Uncharacterized protein n=1 Tax=Lasiosphaeris hirsuta TaxID=260670 RepID=A0AA40DXL3_9PEZI|nr:hypothetical protein B0H67DRAFT_643438 [Lasiosphaeris hirsuta]